MLLEVGRIDRAHGLRGEVVVSLTSDYPDLRLAPGSVLQAGDRSLVVRSSRPHQDRWIVVFEDVGDRAAAEALRGEALRAEPVADEGALWVHELVGAEVVDVDGAAWGRVESVQDNPAHALLVVDDGTLVPIVFVADASGLPDRVVIDPPPGLRRAELQAGSPPERL
ncbi:MAG: 16S rRNA processing protein RimM [Actinobacteria bacterium]|nr:16S rRNA processing protein RimM [Actinomycetota bacterium]